MHKTRKWRADGFARRVTPPSNQKRGGCELDSRAKKNRKQESVTCARSKYSKNLTLNKMK